MMVFYPPTLYVRVEVLLAALVAAVIVLGAVVLARLIKE
jgi:hypothetical protein